MSTYMSIMLKTDSVVQEAICVICEHCYCVVPEALMEEHNEKVHESSG